MRDGTRTALPMQSDRGPAADGPTVVPVMLKKGDAEAIPRARVDPLAVRPGPWAPGDRREAAWLSRHILADRQGRGSVDPRAGEPRLR